MQGVILAQALSQPIASVEDVRLVAVVVWMALVGKARLMAQVRKGCLEDRAINVRPVPAVYAHSLHRQADVFGNIS